MADEIQGALAQAQQAPAAPAASAPLNNKDLIANYFTKVQAQDAAATTALNERRRKLLELTSARQQMFDPKLLRLSAALARPTQTGSFGESLGYASAAMADEQEKELARKQQELKLQMEIEQMMQAQGRQMLGNELAANLMANRQAPTASGAPMSSAVPPAAAPAPVSAPPMPVVSGSANAQTSPFIDGRPTGALQPIARAPAAPVQEAPVQVASQNLFDLAPRKKGSFDDLDEDSLFALGLVSPDLTKAIEQRKENARKERETEIKEAEYGIKKSEFGLKKLGVDVFVPGVGNIKVPSDVAEKIQKTDNIKDLEALFKKNNLPWNVVTEKDGTVRPMTPNELERQKEEFKAEVTGEVKKYPIPELGSGTYLLRSVDMAKYYKAKEAEANGDPNPKQKWFNEVMPEAGYKVRGATIKPKAVGEASGIQSEEQRKVGEESAIERGKKEAAADVEFGNNIMKEGTNAHNVRNTAKNLGTIASTNPKILDIMQDTNITDALARTIQNGVQTPWGSVSIDPKDIYTAIDNYAQANPNKKITKLDRDAYSLFLRDVAQLTIQERRMSRGEGAISDKETGLFQQVNVLPNDSALAVRLKSRLILERANVAEKIGDAFYAYKKKYNGTYEDFTHSNEFRTIRNNYDATLDRIRNQNAEILGGRRPSSQAPAQTNTPTEGRLLPAESSVNTRVYSQTGQRTK